MCNLLPKFLLVTLLLRPVLTGLLKARPMGQIKVVGPGHSVWSVSLEACVQLCDSSDQCDAINYHSSTHKCRLFTPCTHVYSTYGSPDYYFYSKRPQIVDHGYVFDKEGDTCIKLLESDSDMSQGDTVCSKQNGRLLYLSGPGSRDIALDLMVRARGRPQFVWTGGGEPWDWKSDFTRSNYFPSLQDSSDSLCSILEITGHWHRVPCNQGKYMSLCEVPAFYTLFQFHTLHPNSFHSGVITPTFSPRTFPSYPTLSFPSYDALTPPSFPHPYNPFSPPSTENYPPYPQPVAPFPPTYPPYDGRIPPQYPIYPYPPYPGGFTTLSPGSYPSYSTSDPYPPYPGGFTTLSPGSYPSYSTSGPFPPLRPTEQVPTYGTPPTYPTYIPSTLPPPFFTTNSIPPTTSSFPSYVPPLPTESTTIAPPTYPPATTPPPTYTNPPLPPTTPTKSPPPTYSTPTSTYGPPQVPQTLPPAAPPQYPSYYPSTRPSVYYPSLPQPPTKFPQTPSFAYPGPLLGVSPAPFPPRPPYDTPPLNYHPLPNPPIIYHHPPHPPQYPSYKPNYRPPPNYNPPYQPPNRVPFNLTPPPPPPGYECQVTSPPLTISTFSPAIDPYFPPLYIYPPGYQGQPLPGLPTPHYKGYVSPAPHPSNIPYRPFFNYHDKPPFQGKTFIVKDDQAYEIPTVNHHHHHADWERGYSINGRSVSVGNQTNGTPSTHHSQTQFTNNAEPADSNTGRFLTAKLSDQNNLSGNNSDAKFFLSQTHYSRNQFNPNDDLQPKKEQNGTVEIENDKTTHRKENTTTVINRNSSFNTNVEYTRSGKIPSRATVEIQRGGVVSRILPNRNGVDSLY